MGFLPYVSLVFLVCHYIAVVGSVNDEGLALLSFKQAVNNLPEGYLSNWNSSDANPCSWHGVTCTGGKVVSLHIPNKKLSAFVPPDLGKLSSLRRINLRNNNFSGNLPVQFFNASKLQSLILSGNSFSGPVPSQLGNLRYLQVLDLSQNLFSGLLPPSLVQCKRMKTLVLDQNNFTGSIPNDFGTNLVALQKLDLSFNNLSGLIPDDISNLTSLKGTLSLSHNLFSGSIPASLGSLAEKVYINLSYNNLSGIIPQNAGLLNLGPPAFVGNHLLCGLPLKVPCPPNTSAPHAKPLPYDPSYDPSHHSSKAHHLTSCAVITISVVIVLGICITMFLFYYRYKKATGCKWGENVGGCHFEEKLMIKKEFFCFARNDLDNLSENSEQYEFVPLDSQVEFDLEELLKASAFLLGKSTIGIVYKVVLNNGIAVAVRRLGHGGWQRFKEFQTEVEAIGKMRHPNIVDLRAYFWSVDEKLLIYDYIPNGNLATAIHGNIFLLPNLAVSA